MDATQPRSPVLVFFTVVANVYLIAFALHAAVSVADEAMLVFGGTSLLAPFRNQLAIFVALYSLVMAFTVAFVPQLPKLLFVPLILSAVWFAAGAPPFTPAIDDRAGMMFLALTQLAIATAAFLLVQLKAGRALLSAATLPVKSHLLLRIALASAVIVALVPVGLAALGAWALVSATEAQTQGHVRFTWSEIQARETVMRRDAKTVLLIATAHIAERSFYEEIYARIPRHAVVLAEGISDEKGLLGGDKSRNEAARFLGLETQDVFEGLLGPATAQSGTAAKPPSQAPAGAPTSTRARPDVVRADVDVSEFSPPTLRCLREDIAIGNAAVEGKDGPKATPQCSDADRKVFWDEILYTRNNRLLKVYETLASKYDVFVVPWGAMHMPDLELAFKERGFRVERTRMLTLARYETVAGHVFGSLTAFKLRGPGLRPYEISGQRLQP